ncbi:MAG: GxxExxY protein [Anaerolineales bacterium]
MIFYHRLQGYFTNMPVQSLPKNYREPDEETNNLTRDVIGALIEVHRKLGPGFLESVYEEAICLELEKRKIPYERQAKLTVMYDGVPIGEGRVDLLVADKLILELKSVETLLPIHQAQLMSYLKMAHCELGLLVNFNVPILKQGIKRIIMTGNK